MQRLKGMMIGRGRSNEVSQTNEEYISGPIITGLKKTDKISCRLMIATMEIYIKHSMEVMLW